MVAVPLQVSIQQYSDTFWFKFLLSAMSATVAEVATYPLDLTKTRLQIQGEAGAKQCSVPYRGAIRTGIGIIKEEGLPRLWRGVTPAIYRHVIYTGLRMVCYEQMREHRLGKNPDGSFPLWKAIVGGLTAGGFAQFCASPADLVKVQMQMEGKRRMEGMAPRVKNAAHAFKTILAKGGVRGLWKGCIPNVQRSALVNLGDLTTYDSVKRFILTRTQMKDNYVTHTLASASSGLVGAVMGTPADVIKARVMNQPTDAHGRGLLYKNSIDCLRQTIKGEGFWALYKGFVPAWCRMAPWSLTFWMCYENIRKFAGVTSF